jgi:putative ABC transport system substrate-binding protein
MISCSWHRLQLLVGLIAASCGALAACAAATAVPRSEVAQPSAPPPAQRRGLPVVSIVAPDDPKLAPLIRPLEDELGEDFDVLIHPIHAEGDTAETLGGLLDRDRPRLVILINNSAAKLYREWARRQAAPPASLILMASFAHVLQRSVPNSLCIAYEVPAVTSFVGLRALGKPVNRVGVIYRKALAPYVRAQEELARVERISFHSEELQEDFEMRDLKAALIRTKQSGVDVLWLPNDNQLLSRQLVAKAWLPYLDRLELPVIVGVPSLVRADHAFGTYGAIPDPEALAVQAADLVFEIRDADWSIEGQRVRLPLSAKTYLSAPLGKRYGVLESRLQTVDVVVGRSSGEE